MAASSRVRASAPGRVNLIGEHTDYNGGFVLPTAIPQQTRVEICLRTDRRVQVTSQQAREPADYTLGDEVPRGDWLDYVQGLSWALREAGFTLASGYDLAISSDVPLGAGLSSSASLEVAVLRALRTAFDLAPLDDVRLAQLGQIAENDFVGARCGIMDQMAASLADSSSALFLDTRSLDFRRLSLPPAADLVVIDSGIAHGIASSEYNTRRAQCEAAASELGVPQLRDLTEADLPRLAALPELLGRRARHVITEDARVLHAVVAIEEADVERLGALFDASHASLRDDFQVSVPEVDLLVALAQSDADVFGARMTGGGFGGSVVVLARRGSGLGAAERVARLYADESGKSPRVVVPPQ